jgi:hypothetical protein
MRVRNPDRSPFRINRWDTTQLYPALLRLSAMISRYLILNDLRLLLYWKPAFPLQSNYFRAVSSVVERLVYTQ